MIHQLNSLYPVRYTAFALCVFGLLYHARDLPRITKALAWPRR